MLKALTTLIKKTESELKTLRHNISIYEAKKEELINKIKILQKQFEKEKKLAEKSIEASFDLPNYTAFVNMKQQNLDNSVKAMDHQIDQISEEIREKFSELKQYEIILEAKEKELLELQEKIEQNNLDEIATYKASMSNKESE